MSAALGTFPAPPQQRTIRLPTGATLTGSADLPKGMDEQCKVAFNLMLQMGPFMASIECLVDILQFVFDTIEFSKSVPDAITSLDPSKPMKAAKKLAEDGKKLTACFGWFLGPIPLCQFVKDVLTMIHDFISCLLELMDSVLTQQLELQVKMGDAQDNPELLDVLNLAQDNLSATMGQAVNSMGPILNLLQLMGGFMKTVGAGSLAVPSLDQLTGGSVEAVLQPIKDLNDALGVIVEALPC
jgi:hypothetical protein